MSINLRALARRAMAEHGFLAEIPTDAEAQADVAVEPAFEKLNIKDLRSLLWSSIDNDESRDLDQIEYARSEDGATRVYVGIAEVDWFVGLNTRLDEFAEHNTTSVYTGVITFPMLPERLSTNLSSLNENQDRLAIVFEMLIDTHGRMMESSIYRAAVRNQAQLTYNGVAAWLDGKAGTGEADKRTISKIGQSAELQDQLRLQDRVAEILRNARHEKGALAFHSSELNPVVSSEGVVLDLEIRQQNRASLLIEDLMIASNNTAAIFLDNNHSPSIRRVVRTPERWERIVALAASLGQKLPSQPDVKSLAEFLEGERQNNPGHFADLSLSVVKLLGRGEYVANRPEQASDGHFALAVEAYSHSTAPNRRYADLLTQRLIKAVLAKSTYPYSLDQLNQLATHCTEREDAATKVERLIKKCAAAVLLEGRVGETFEAVVTGVNDKGSWVRASHPQIEGKLIRATRHVDVGDRVRVRLDSVNPERGFIDFELT